MKWIVTSDFFRTVALKGVKVVGACKGTTTEQPHPNHFHRGSIIELGESANNDELLLSDKDEEATKRLIATLRYAGRIADASDARVVAKVEELVAIDNKRIEREKAAAKVSDSAGIMEALSLMIQKAAAKA